MKKIIAIVAIFIQSSMAIAQNFYSQAYSPVGTYYDSYQREDGTVVVYGAFDLGSVAEISPAATVTYQDFPADTVVTMAVYQGYEFAASSTGQLYRRIAGGVWEPLAGFPSAYLLYTDTVFNDLYLFELLGTEDTSLSTRVWRLRDATLSEITTLTPFVSGATHTDGMLWLGLGRWALQMGISTLYGIGYDGSVHDIGMEVNGSSWVYCTGEITVASDGKTILRRYFDDECKYIESYDGWFQEHETGLLTNGNYNTLPSATGTFCDHTDFYAYGYVNDITAYNWEITPFTSYNGWYLTGDSVHCDYCSETDWVNCYYDLYRMGDDILIVADGAVRILNGKVMAGTSTVYLQTGFGYTEYSAVVWFGDGPNVSPSSTEDFGMESFVVYPNPTSTVANTGPGEFWTYDITGKLVSHSYGEALQVSSWDPGVYTVRSSKGAVNSLVVTK
jgi:hypothetical protein